MVARLTVDEFFDALHNKQVYPLVDTPKVRMIVEKTVRAICADYPVKDRWPVLDLESAYESYLNAQPTLVDWHQNGYKGTVQAGSFDDRYTLDEWFGDFTKQWNLKDTSEVRAVMLARLPDGVTWRSPDLYSAHECAIKEVRPRLMKWLLG